MRSARLRGGWGRRWLSREGHEKEDWDDTVRFVTGISELMRDNWLCPETEQYLRYLFVGASTTEEPDEDIKHGPIYSYEQKPLSGFGSNERQERRAATDFAGSRARAGDSWTRH
jgi:hypothetical protein